MCDKIEFPMPAIDARYQATIKNWCNTSYNSQIEAFNELLRISIEKGLTKITMHVECKDDDVIDALTYLGYNVKFDIDVDKNPFYTITF